MTLDGGDLDDPNDDKPLRPWLPPEDRLWRHPSEIASAQAHNRAQTRSGPVPASSRRWPLVAVAGAVCAVLVSGLVMATKGRPPADVAVGTGQTLSQQPGAPGLGTTLALSTPGSPTSAVTTASVQASPSFMGLVSRVLPSIVGIQVSSRQGAWHGSGILLRSDGMVLTTERLLDGASKITVVTSDGRTGSATVVGKDPDTDVAVIRFPAQGMTAAAFTRDQSLVTGQMAVAVSAGQPGSRPAVSIGTVQALAPPVSPPNGPPLLDFMQTDAPSSNDAEGAALVGQDGLVIGMAAVSNPATSHARVGRGQTLWLATPGALAWNTAQQLITTGHVVRAWLGIEGSDAGPATQPEQAVVANPGGARITSVTPGSPAAAAGLEVGDVIQAINAQPVSSMLALRSDLRLLSPGARIQLTILHDSKLAALPATLASQ
ncbi:MAG: hypothetical protein DLM54_06550 [Acidimicrobiales bacterium]|nr:MAG: hypothetical protein DLM54_06550 [Acidimicrobiales bacterium]